MQIIRSTDVSLDEINGDQGPTLINFFVLITVHYGQILKHDLSLTMSICKYALDVNSSVDSAKWCRQHFYSKLVKMARDCVNL